MSYYTDVEFTFEDDPPDFEAVLDHARPFIEAQKDRYPNTDFVLDQLRTALEEEKGDFKGLQSDDFEGLMKHVSAAFAGIRFYVRGLGEEYCDVWLRVFEDGEIIFQAGPFDDEIESAFRVARQRKLDQG